MPVTFYPHKPINSLEHIIVNNEGIPLHGEIDIYRKLYEDLNCSKDDWYIWHDLKLPVHSDHFNDNKKTSAQIDFLILHYKGILVLEVKGGHITVSNGCFYYGEKSDIKLYQNPFSQSEGYKFTLKEKILNNIGKCFYCHAVAFPHVDISFKSPIFDDSLLWSRYNATRYNNSIEVFLNNVFDQGRLKQEKYNREYPTFSGSTIQRIIATLNPFIKDRISLSSLSTMEWLNVDNLEILEGLQKNKRIMLEGPPGSGKTTLAKAFMDLNFGKKGLYLCWNSLLMHYTKKIIEDRIENIEVTTLIRFLKKLELSLDIGELLQFSVDQFYEVVKNIFARLTNNKKLPLYDYIIVDEGQDIFDRGIDIILDNIADPDGNGLLNGQILLLYDIDQSYKNNGRDISTIADILAENFAHYKLNEIKRSLQNPSIRKLAQNVLEEPNSFMALTEDMKDASISIERFKNLESIKKYIVQKYLNNIRDQKSSLKGAQCIILVISELLLPKYKELPGVKYWLEIKDIEELSDKNIADSANILRYTSMLKYKGLEKENVILITNTPDEANKYELYVGITRAIQHLDVLIVD